MSVDDSRIHALILSTGFRSKVFGSNKDVLFQFRWPSQIPQAGVRELGFTAASSAVREVFFFKLNMSTITWIRLL